MNVQSGGGLAGALADLGWLYLSSVCQLRCRVAGPRLVWASSHGAGILGTETASPFQASACITFVNVLLVWVSHMARPKERGREKINSTCKNTSKVLLPFLQFTTVIKLVPVKHLDERKWMLSYYSRCIFLSNIISPRWIDLLSSKRDLAVPKLIKGSVYLALKHTQSFL